MCALYTHDQFQHVHFQFFQITGFYAFFLVFVIELFDLSKQVLKNFFTVDDMAVTVIGRLGAHGFYVKTHTFSRFAEVVLVEHLYLIKGPAEVFRAERLVLIVAYAVLIVKVNSP